MKTLLISIILILTACSDSSNNSKKNPNSEKTTVITNSNPGIGHIAVFGDSLAAGYNATQDDIKPSGCFKKIAHSSVVDLAIPGETSFDLLSRIEEVLNVNPNLIFISSGGNDTMYDAYQPGSYPRSKTIKEMEQIFDLAISTGALVVYLKIAPPIGYGQRLKDISTLATSKGIVVVDGMNGFWNDPKYMSDQIHPNDLGYKIMCDRILESIKTHYP